MAVGWGGPVRLLSQTSPIPRSPDGDNKPLVGAPGVVVDIVLVVAVVEESAKEG